MTKQSQSVIFAAELLPHRSLSAFGLRNLFLLVGALAFLHVLFVVVTGTWIVLLFWGLDFLLLYGAFWLNNRAARVREYVEVRSDAIEVRKLSVSGQQNKLSFNPVWTEFKVERRGDFGIERMLLKAKGQRAELGSFLNPDDRESFAKAMKAALATAKFRQWRY